MPRDTITIDNFDRGLITNPDMQDIPNNCAVYSKNVDPDVAEGVLQSVKQKSLISNSVGIKVSRSAWIQKTASVWSLIYTDNTNILSIADFYGTQADVNQAAKIPKCFIVSNKEVHMGMGAAETDPYWAGYISYGQFGGSAPADLYTIIGYLDHYHGTNAGKFNIESCTYNSHTEVDADFFKVGDVYAYSFSLMYDGYQESPIQGASTGGFDVAPSVLTGSNSADYCTIALKAYGIASTNKRISGMCIYRAKYDYNGILGTWYLVKNVDINDASWTTSGSDKTYSFADYGTMGSSFEERTGIPQTIIYLNVQHTIAAQVNSFHFIGQCYQTGLPNAFQMIFRSQRYRYDSFNWIKDFLILPFIPIAMAGFFGKLFVWGSNKMLRIDPENLIIEDSFEGVSIFSDKSFVSTDYGLIWGDKNGAYVTDGSQVIELSLPIKTKQYGSGTSWEDVFGSISTDTFHVVYSSIKKVVIFCNTYNGYTLTYSFARKRWDYWELGDAGSSANSSLFVGKDGEVYYSTNANQYKLWGSSSYESLIWVSREIAPDASQSKKWYKILDDSSNVTVTYGVNGAAVTTALTSNNIATGDRKAKSLQFKLATTSANTVSKCWSLGIVKRDLEGKR
jgi:hypothetical protein